MTAGGAGGPRLNAGRKPGSKNKVKAEIREQHQALLAKEGPKMLARLLASPDDRVLLGLYSLLASYAYGKPAQSVSVQHSAPSLEGVLRELAERRLGRTRQPLLPAAGETDKELA